MSGIIRISPSQPATRREFLRDGSLGAGLAVTAVTVNSSGAATKSGERELALTRAGKPSAQIVIAAKPLPVERHAAGELQKYVFQMSGAQLPIAATAAKGKTHIYLGAAAPPRGLDLSQATLGFDGYWVKTSGEDIILAGVKPYSCLGAVYHLLERHLGCGFFEPPVPERLF